MYDNTTPADKAHATSLFRWYMNESWHTYGRVMAHVWMRHGSHMNESWHAWMGHDTPCVWQHHTCRQGTSDLSSQVIFEWVMAHIWMSHGTHMNEAWLTYECVMARMNGSWHTLCMTTHEWWHTYEWVMAHICHDTPYVWQHHSCRQGTRYLSSQVI